MMTNVKKEGFERPVGAEVAHYFGVAERATTGMLHSLYRALGPEVLDQEDLAAMFPGQNELPNVVNLSAQPPVLGEVATESAGVAPEQATNTVPLGNVAPIAPFPPVEPPFANAA